MRRGEKMRRGRDGEGDKEGRNNQKLRDEKSEVGFVIFETRLQGC
jgi:hypothetical protein